MKIKQNRFSVFGADFFGGEKADKLCGDNLAKTRWPFFTQVLYMM